MLIRYREKSSKQIEKAQQKPMKKKAKTKQEKVEMDR